MMATQVRLASSTRLILAMFQLIAAIEDNFGRALFDILSKQYPDCLLYTSDAADE